MGDADQTAVKQPETTKTGFQLHPENINRNGRPKRGWAWNELIEDAVNETAKNQTGDILEIKKIITKRLVKMAADGDLLAIKEIMNRMDGMPKESHEMSGSIDVIPIMGGSSRKFDKDVPGDNSIQEDK